jgi:S1-C subfamily serine protease
MKSQFLFAACAFAALSACAQPKPLRPAESWTWQGQSFSSSEALLMAVRDEQMMLSAAVGPVSERIGGRAKAVIPDVDRLKPLVRQLEQGKPQSDHSIDTKARAFQLALAAKLDALERAKLFDSITRVIQNDTSDPVIDGYDHLVFFEVETTGPNLSGQWLGRWKVRRKEGRGEVAFRADPGMPRTQQASSWVDELRKATARAATMPAAAVRPSAPGAPATSILSGIVVAAGGEILTNHHGVANCRELKVSGAGRTEVPVTVVARDNQNDLALLKAESTYAAAASFRDGSGARQGEMVMAAGYPLGGLLASGPSVTVGAVSALAGLRDDTRFLQVSTPIQPGNSGGPLLDSSGNVAGVVTAKLNAVAIMMVTGTVPENVSFALKPSVVRTFLDANGIRHSVRSAGRELKASELADQARSFTVQVSCLR